MPHILLTGVATGLVTSRRAAELQRAWHSAIGVQVIVSLCRTRKRADPLSPPRRLIRVSDRRSKRPARKGLSPTLCVSLAMLSIGRLVAHARRALTFGGGADERPCRREVLSSRPAFAGSPAWFALPSAWAKARTMQIEDYVAA
jgi:hypothetical protein